MDLKNPHIIVVIWFLFIGIAILINAWIEYYFLNKQKAGSVVRKKATFMKNLIKGRPVHPWHPDHAHPSCTLLLVFCVPWILSALIMLLVHFFWPTIDLRLFFLIALVFSSVSLGLCMRWCSYFLNVAYALLFGTFFVIACARAFLWPVLVRFGLGITLVIIGILWTNCTELFLGYTFHRFGDARHRFLLKWNVIQFIAYALVVAALSTSMIFLPLWRLTSH